MIRSTIITLAAVALISTGCTSGMTARTIVPSKETVTFQVPAKDVKGLEIFNSFHVTYTQGPKCSVTVTAPANLRDELKIKMNGTTLTASLKDNVSLRGNSSIDIVVTSPYINDISFANSSTLDIANGLSAPGYVKIDANNSAAINISSINAPEFKAEFFNSSSIKIGDVKSTSVNMESFNSADVKIDKLTADNIVTENYNSSDVRLKGITAKTLKAECYNSSSLKLEGRADHTMLESYNVADIDTSGLNK